MRVVYQTKTLQTKIMDPFWLQPDPYKRRKPSLKDGSKWNRIRPFAELISYKLRSFRSSFLGIACVLGDFTPWEQVPDWVRPDNMRDRGTKAAVLACPLHSRRMNMSRRRWETETAMHAQRRGNYMDGCNGWENIRTSASVRNAIPQWEKGRAGRQAGTHVD